MVEAKGRLRHHFWGDYRATIALAFLDAGSAADALIILGKGWKLSEREPKALIWHGGGEDFERVKAQLAGFGLKIDPCGRKDCRRQCRDASIDGVPHSIDLGPAFTVEIPTVAREQVALF